MEKLKIALNFPIPFAQNENMHLPMIQLVALMLSIRKFL